MKTRIKLFRFNLIALLIFGSVTGFSQQWFVKHWQITDGIPAGSKPTFEPTGSLMDDEDVILYGTIGMNDEYLPGAHGKSDMIIMRNDQDGNSIWAFTIGTPDSREMISRVVKVGNDLFITGHQDYGDYFDAFIMKVRVTSSGGSYSMNIVNQPLIKVNSKFYDLEYAPTTIAPLVVGDDPRGIAVCGHDFNSGQAFVFRANLALDFTTSSTWLKYYESHNHEGETEPLELRSLCLVKYNNSLSGGIGTGRPGDGDGISDDGGGSYITSLAVCGQHGSTYDREGIILRLKTSTGQVQDDFSTRFLYGGDCLNEFTQSTSSVNLNGEFSWGFTEIIQVDEGDLVVMGQNGIFGPVPLGIMRVDNKLKNAKWFSTVGDVYQSQDYDPIVYDLLKTKFGFAVVSNHYDDSFPYDYRFTHFDDNGHFKFRSTDRPSASSYGISSTLLTQKENQPTKWKDFALQCGNFIHYPGWEHNFAPYPNWNGYNIVHAKTGYQAMKEGCVEEEDQPGGAHYCENMFWLNREDLIEQAGEFTLEDGPHMELGNHEGFFEELCASTCAQTCLNSTHIIYVCPGSDDIDVHLEVENPSQYDRIVWNNGLTDARITVTAIGSYTAYAVNVDGCLEMITYSVQYYPELVINTQVTGVTCHGNQDGEVCFSTSTGIVDISGFGPSGSFGLSFSNPTTSFCLTQVMGPVSGGSYSGTLTDVNGCIQSFWVNVNEPAAIAITSSQVPTTSGCNGSATFNVTGGTQPYSYSLNTSSTNIASGSNYLGMVFTSLCPDIYTFSIVDANGCTDQNTIEVGDGENKMDEAAATQAVLDAISIYPNPSSGLVQISLPSPLAGTVEVTDLLGQTVQINTFESSTSIDVNLKTLPAGNYFIKVTCNTLTHMEQVILID